MQVGVNRPRKVVQVDPVGSRYTSGRTFPFLSVSFSGSATG